MNHSPRLPFFALLLAMILWGSSFVAFKYAVLHYDPIVVVFGRLLISALLFLVFIPFWRPVQVRRQDLGLMLFMALCEPCFYFWFEGQALTLTTASQAGMVAATLPVLVAVTSGFFLGEILTRKSWAGLILAVVGVGWVSVTGSSTAAAPNPLAGNALEFAAMLCAAGYTVSMKKLCDLYSPWFLTAVQSLVGTVFFFPLLLLPSTSIPTIWPAGASLAVLYLAVCISIGAYGLYNYGISKLPAWQASAFVNLIPVFSMFLGWALLDEVMNMAQLGGVVVVFCGVLLSQQWPGNGQHKNASGRLTVSGGRVGEEAVSRTDGLVEATVRIRK